MHRVLSFAQSKWLEPWIQYCTRGRQNATSEFESNLFKLMANAIYGKSLENLRGRRNVRLIVDPKKLQNAVSKPALVSAEIITADINLVKSAKTTLLLNKPIYTGFTILEYSKLVMAEFYYDYLVEKYQDRVKLLYTDTDSLILHVRTENIHADMAQDMERFDTSNFPKDHPLYSTRNKKVVAKMKSKTANVHPQHFVGLRSKLYSLLVVSPGEEKLTAKGIKKSFAEKNLRHHNYLTTLQTKQSTVARFRLVRSNKHVLNTVEVAKYCLSAFSDKRYLLSNGIDSLAYGHKFIKSGVASSM